jgi:hypothetical protein
MRRIVLALALSFAFLPRTAFAARPTDAQIDQLLEVTHSHQLVDSILAQIDQLQKQMFGQALAGETLTDEQQAQVDRLLAISSRNIREAMTWEKLSPIYRRIYADTFDGSDVDAMIAFYKTDAGQHVIDRMPTLMQKTMLETQALIAPTMQKMREEMAREIDKMRKEAGAAPSTRRE